MMKCQTAVHSGSQPHATACATYGLTDVFARGMEEMFDQTEDKPAQELIIQNAYTNSKCIQS